MNFNNITSNSIRIILNSSIHNMNSNEEDNDVNNEEDKEVNNEEDNEVNNEEDNDEDNEVNNEEDNELNNEEDNILLSSIESIFNIINNNITNSNEENYNPEYNWSCRFCNKINLNDSYFCSRCRYVNGSTTDDDEWCCPTCHYVTTGNMCYNCMTPNRYSIINSSLFNHINNLIQREIQGISDNTLNSLEPVKQKVTDNEFKNLTKYTYDSNIHKKDSCCICLEEFKNDDNVIVLRKCCNNHLHHNCIKKWFSDNYKCPLCNYEYVHEVIE